MRSHQVNDLVGQLMSVLPPCPVQDAWRVDTAAVLVRVDGVSTFNRGVDSIWMVRAPSIGLQGGP
jgi:hypothetical protein